jgi:hypothetical protein
LRGRGALAAKTKAGAMPSDFIDEDHLNTFNGWLNYQAVDPDAVSPDELAMLRSVFDKRLATPKIGLMKLPPPLLAGEHRYAVAVRDGADLWLGLWFKRTKKGEFVILIPRTDRDWDPHWTYHSDGRFHAKSRGHIVLEKKLQPLTGPFRGTEHLGSLMGYGPKSVGAICDPATVRWIHQGKIFSELVDVVPAQNGTVSAYISLAGEDYGPWTLLFLRSDGSTLGSYGFLYLPDVID